MSLSVTRYDPHGYILAYEGEPENPTRPQHASLIIDNSSSMKTSIDVSGPLLQQCIRAMHDAIGAFDLNIFLFDSDSRELGDGWHVDSDASVRAICEAIRLQWTPRGTTNPCGAMCMAMRATREWLDAHPGGASTMLVTTDGEFNTRLTYEEPIEDRGLVFQHDYTRDTFRVEMAKQLEAVDPTLGLHFIGLNRGRGAEQLARFRATPEFSRKPMLHEFGEDTDASSAVRHMFPAACGALQVIVKPSTGFSSTELTLHLGASACVCGDVAQFIDANSGEPIRVDIQEGDVTSDITTRFEAHARDEAFHAELDAALATLDTKTVFRTIDRFGDLRSAKVMRSRSSSVKDRGGDNFELVGVLRAQSAQAHTSSPPRLVRS